jgi:hypothetical protein
MFTLFTTTKPFNDHFGVIQINAIRSWKHLHPNSEVIIFGDEDGAAEAARRLNVRHVASVGRNEYGTPLMSDMFEQAKQLASNPILVHINADIILMSDFRKAVELITAWRRRYLIIGLRHNVSVKETLSFEGNWEEGLKALAQTSARIDTGMDCFTFPRDMFDEVPPFAIGRANSDLWPIYEARLQKSAVVDVTQQVTIIHQQHNYSHIGGGWEHAYLGPESKRNRQILYEITHKSFTIRDATHVLTPDGIKARCHSCYPSCSCNPSLAYYE